MCNGAGPRPKGPVPGPSTPESLEEAEGRSEPEGRCSITIRSTEPALASVATSRGLWRAAYSHSITASGPAYPVTG